MKATLPATEHLMSEWYVGTKELIGCMSAIVLHAKFSDTGTILSCSMKEQVIARFYRSRHAKGSAPIYCNLFVHGRPYSINASGKATGGGYHKLSAALDDAISAAGIRLMSDDGTSTDISGHGDRAMVEAMEAIAREVSGQSAVLIVRHDN